MKGTWGKNRSVQDMQQRKLSWPTSTQITSLPSFLHPQPDTTEWLPVVGGKQQKHHKGSYWAITRMQAMSNVQVFHASRKRVKTEEKTISQSKGKGKHRWPELRGCCSSQGEVKGRAFHVLWHGWEPAQLWLPSPCHLCAPAAPEVQCVQLGERVKLLLLLTLYQPIGMSWCHLWEEKQKQYSPGRYASPTLNLEKTAEINSKILITPYALLLLF